MLRIDIVCFDNKMTVIVDANQQIKELGKIVESRYFRLTQNVK
jgi:hypothetical protein